MQEPWEHPDWYDLHDNAMSAGPDKEMEQYRELVLSLPPLDRDGHVIDVGTGTGKLAQAVAIAYPRLGRMTLIEPNTAKLERALSRVEGLVPSGKVVSIPYQLGRGEVLPKAEASIVTLGHVLMPVILARGGALGDGLEWLRKALAEIRAMLRPGAWLYVLDTLALPTDKGDLRDAVRRLSMPELKTELREADLEAVECIYRFRDRVVIRARRPL